MEENNSNVNLGAIKALNKDKIVIISIVVGLLVIALGIFGYIYYSANVAPVITFDGGKVSSAEYSIYYKTFATMLQYYGYEEEEIPALIAEKAGMDKILLMKAKQDGVTQTEEEKKEVDAIFEEKENVDAFKDRGIDPEKMKELYYSDNIINAYIEKKKSELSNEDVIAYIKSTNGEDANLNEYVTRHILFSTVDSTGASLSDEEVAAVKTKAEGVLARVLAGEDFSTLAKEFSDDSTATKGGEYKMYMDDATVTEYVDAVKTLQVGQIYANLVETSYGYHIIKLESIVENGRANSDTERENLVNKGFETLKDELKLNIKKDKLKKVVYQITGTEIEIY